MAHHQAKIVLIFFIKVSRGLRPLKLPRAQQVGSDHQLEPSDPNKPNIVPTQLKPGLRLSSIVTNISAERSVALIFGWLSGLIWGLASFWLTIWAYLLHFGLILGEIGAQRIIPVLLLVTRLTELWL